MRKSQNTRKTLMGLIALAIAVIGGWPRPCSAKLRSVVGVKIEAERHVTPPHTIKNHIFMPLKLTFHIPSPKGDQPITMFIKPGPVKAGAGLVVEHVSPDGTRTRQSLVPEAWWFSEPEKLEVKPCEEPRSLNVSTTFNLWVLPGMHLDFSKPGIYHISYIHPWGDSENDSESPVFRSNRLTIACVEQERYDQLHKMLREKSELALASYRFKNLPSAVESPEYRRGEYLKTIDEAIKNGDRQDKVLLLLGSPDRVSVVEKRAGTVRKWDEEWDYETSPIGGYHVYLKDGCVVKKGSYGQWSGEAPGSDTKDKMEKGG